MFNYQGRLFTFGCSFTQYIWPTWADILAREFEYYENWGSSGAGNQYIFHSLVECYQRNLLNSNDTISWINNYQLFDKFDSNRPKIRF
jgi:hypothetical protein